MASKGCLTCFAIIYLIGIIVGIVLMAKSFRIVPLNHAALKQNSFSRSIDQNTVYLPGRYFKQSPKFKSDRYFTGVTGKFILYPTTWSL